MGIFSTIPWKTIAGVMPAIMDMVRNAREQARDDNSLVELRLKVERLEAREVLLGRYVRLLLVGLILFGAMAGAALAIGIKLLSCPCP
jgi:hypothetical protein